MRKILILVLALAAVLLFLLASAGANSALFARHYPWLLGANVLIALALAAMVGIQVRVLWQEYQQRQFGSRLKLKLIGMFVLLAVIPGALIYGVSVRFAVHSIESWYNVRVDTALRDGLELGRSALNALLDQLAERSREAAAELGEGAQPPSVPSLVRLREKLGADSLQVFTLSGRVQATAGDVVTSSVSLVPEGPPQSDLRQLRILGSLRHVNADARGITLRVVQPIPSRLLGSETSYLQVISRVPESLARSAEAIQNLHQEYQELLLARDGLKRIYLVTLTLALLLAMFAAMAVAFMFARALSAPLSILAEGTQAVAAGDFTPRQALPARDELGVLTQSFNRMTQQLNEARAQAEKNRAAVDAARSYLESVLANLSSGVLAFSSAWLLRAANRGALQTLADDLTDYEDLPLAAWQRHATFRDAVLRGFSENEGDWRAQIEIDLGDGRLQTLLMHGSRLPEAGGGGTVVVFEDISQLLSAQRNAAWAEVARRLAHEIKNPLTPIQLAAERLEHKLAAQLGEEDRAMLARATQTIVNQVESMKNLVNSFRDYARLPPPQLSALDLNALIREVLVLYEANHAIVEELANELPLVAGDASQLRQVIHNLLQNAQDATAEQGNTARIVVSTRRDGRRVELAVRDNGSGFPPAILARACEPYVTSKPRGSGLGLAIVNKIMDEHRGELLIANHPQGGAEVRLRLRLADVAQSTGAATLT